MGVQTNTEQHSVGKNGKYKKCSLWKDITQKNYGTFVFQFKGVQKTSSRENSNNDIDFFY